MTKPKFIEFDNGVKAIIFSKGVLRAPQRNYEFMLYLTSGLYDLIRIEPTNELMFIERGRPHA